ncbi:MAG: hypothetical protein LBO62_07365, partial [Endomicrobium sp.]|nr:hypothetical protein [Endomicrobium sp.]
MKIKEKIMDYFALYWKGNIFMKSVSLAVALCFLVNIANLPVYAQDNSNYRKKKEYEQIKRQGGGDEVYHQFKSVKDQVSVSGLEEKFKAKPSESVVNAASGEEISVRSGDENEESSNEQKKQKEAEELKSAEKLGDVSGGAKKEAAKQSVTKEQDKTVKSAEVRVVDAAGEKGNAVDYGKPKNVVTTTLGEARKEISEATGENWVTQKTSEAEKDKERYTVYSNRATGNSILVKIEDKQMSYPDGEDAIKTEAQSDSFALNGVVYTKTGSSLSKWEDEESSSGINENQRVWFNKSAITSGKNELLQKEENVKQASAQEASGKEIGRLDGIFTAGKAISAVAAESVKETDIKRLVKFIVAGEKNSETTIYKYKNVVGEANKSDGQKKSDDKSEVGYD